MSPSIQDCLATFSLSAMLNNDDAIEKARVSLEAFVEPFDHAPLAATAALRELRDAFLAMKLDSHAAFEILAYIDTRIATPPGEMSGAAACVQA